jgi:predicted SnoaL-like aldol condensation-catalyzing enzyme
MVADGLEGFGAFMAQMAEQGITMDYTEVHQVIGEGNFVLTLSEGALGGEPTAFYDLFRLEDGLIVEHWDVIAPMPGADAPHNEAGKF